jgi:hypothetical protein
MIKIQKTKIIFILILFFGFFGMAKSSEAADFYVAQNLVGSDTGADCANAHAVTWFNTSGNWANPKVSGKIGPGDTAHLCGTITSALSTRANGNSGLPITILFETNAKISLPASNCLNISNAYITVDGGTNGIIENNANGTGLTYQLPTKGIVFTGASNLEVKHLTIQNLYVHTSVNDSAIDGGTTGAFYANGHGSNISIHNNNFHDSCWIYNDQGASAGATGLYFYNNNMYNYDHGMAITGATTTFSNVNIYNNHFGTTENWDTSVNKYHHDGIHIYFPSDRAIDNVNIYNNLFDGNWGINNTAHLFFEGDYNHVNTEAMTNFTLYNNVFIQYTGNTLNNGFISGGGPNWRWYNNTFLGAGIVNSSCVRIGHADIIFKNNIVSGCTTLISVASGGTFKNGGLDNNLYANVIPGGNSPFVYAGTNESSFSNWKNATGQDGSSSQVSSTYLNNDGTLQLNSTAIGAGLDLISLGILALNFDKMGISRPQGSAWDIGAYEYVSSDTTPPAPPTGLTAS